MAIPHKGEKELTGAAEVTGWTLALKDAAKKARKKNIKVGSFALKYFTCFNSLWLVYSFRNGGKTALRACFDPSGIKEVKSRQLNERSAEFRVRGSSGIFVIRTENKNGSEVLNCKCTFTSKVKLVLTYVPRDIYALDDNYNPLATEGIIHTVQHCPCLGNVYFTLKKPRGGSVFYFQNFTSLNKYFERTKTNPLDNIKGTWPEMGMSLPACEDNFIPAGSSFVLSDVYITFTDSVPGDEFETSRLYLDLLYRIYLSIPKPKADYYDWPSEAKTALKVISGSKQCYRKINNRFYLNAYVNSTDKPPESMVQLSVLVPLIEYSMWAGSSPKLIGKMKSSLEHFYSAKLNTILRWLPGTEFDKEEKSEEEYHDKMDSWYHLHILLNLGRLVEKGDGAVSKIFFKSVDFAIKTAHKFNYEWPVFYDMRTLRIIKAETSEGKGGEIDVPGVYAHVMLQAYELTKDDKYVKEAEQAAKKLKGLGMHLVYQTNITVFNAVAMARLWEITGKKVYIDLAILCAANIVTRFWIWSCRYGYAKSYETFMGLLPLHDAKYLAVYEESESMAALYKLAVTLRDNAPESLRAMTAEYMKYVLHRGKFYYPQNLPAEAIHDGKQQSGTIDKKLSIPLEDIQHGWEKSGQVGQEVYGSAAPFIFVSCAYRKPGNVPFSIYCNYPVFDFQYQRKNGSFFAAFKTGGTEMLSCSIKLIIAGSKIGGYSVEYRNKFSAGFKNAKKNKDEFSVPGASEVRIKLKLRDK